MILCKFLLTIVVHFDILESDIDSRPTYGDARRTTAEEVTEAPLLVGGDRGEAIGEVGGVGTLAKETGKTAGGTDSMKEAGTPEMITG